jgi:uridine kinase
MIIAVGGCSTSGKSKFASQLANMLQNNYEKKTKILCQDDFVKQKKDIPLINGHTDWEIPESIEFMLFKNAIIHADENNEIVIAEGLMIYFLPEINKLYDLNFFIDINRKTFFERKTKDFRWGKEPIWYIEHIWESFLKYGQPETVKNIIHIDGTKKININKIVSIVLNF